MSADLKLAVYEYNSVIEKYSVCSYIERPMYVEYQSNYSTNGTFKLVSELTQQNSQALKVGNIIWIEKDVCVLINTVEISSENKITCWGDTCEGLLKSRIVPESKTFENSELSIVFDTLYNSINIIPSMSMVAQNIGGLSYTGTIEPGNFYDIIQSLCERFNIGFLIMKSSAPSSEENETSVNDLNLLLKFYSGQDLSESVTLSQDYESIANFEYTSSNKDEITAVKVLGVDNISVDVEVLGVDSSARKEYFLDCTGIEKEGTQEEYEALLTAKGQEILDAHQPQESYNGDYTGLTFIVTQDFNIGDIVTVSDIVRDIDTTQRVTGFFAQVDNSGRYEKLYFGSVEKTLPRVIDAIIKRLEDLENTPTPSSGGGGGGGTEVTITVQYGIVVQQEDVV